MGDVFAGQAVDEVGQVGVVTYQKHSLPVLIEATNNLNEGSLPVFVDFRSNQDTAGIEA